MQQTKAIRNQPIDEQNELDVDNHTGDEDEIDDILSFLLIDSNTNQTVEVASMNADQASVFQQSNVSNSSLSSIPSSPPILTSSNNTQVGIGGKGGIVYDVNRLKRNLVQETVRKYKNELLSLLSIMPHSSHQHHYSNTPSIQISIEDKIHALIQSNPVSTTTDSNLLEGTWIYMISLPASIITTTSSSFSSTYPILTQSDSTRQQTSLSFVGNEKNKNPEPIITRHGNKNKKKKNKMNSSGPWKTFQRTFYLENVPEEEKPSVVDEMIYWSGWFSSKTFFQVIGVSVYIYILLSYLFILSSFLFDYHP